jgi:ubiquinone/menaquinone biosynthesis C-methylase UbiE
MPIPPERNREHPSAYFVADRSSTEELDRLQTQDALVTASMGGVLPEQPDPFVFQRVLDVGCGTGGWLIALAKTLPSSAMLVGVDVSQTFVLYARRQAEAAGVSDRVEFHVMDALRALEFPPGFFDLVTHRFGLSWVRSWEWPKLLQEYQRVARPGGTIRCVEAEIARGTSPAFTALRTLTQAAFAHAGHLFRLEESGLATDLPPLFHQHGLRGIQTQTYPLEYHAGTEEGEQFRENTRLGFRTAEPFLRKWQRVPDNYSRLCQQALEEMRQPDFVATAPIFTIWGKRGTQEP